MTREYSFINFFRATAALWVIAAHCMFFGGWHKSLIPNPKIAVDLFMMITGYLMVANAVVRSGFEPLSKPGNWRRFWLRRFFRIAPAYYVSLTLAAVLDRHFLAGYTDLRALDPQRWAADYIYDPARITYSVSSIFLHITFLFGLHPTLSVSSGLPDWSLSLEMQFYLMFPALLLLMQRTGLTRSALWIGLTAIVLGRLITHFVYWYEPSLIILKLQYFLAGMLVFRATGNTVTIKTRILSTMVAVLLVSFDYRYGKQLIALPVLLLLMTACGWLEDSNMLPFWLASTFNLRATRFGSDMSYGVYLFHGFFISACGSIISSNRSLMILSPTQRTLAMFVFVSIGAYLAALIVHTLVESPGLRLGKNIIRHVIPIAPDPATPQRPGNDETRSTPEPLINLESTF